MSSSYSSLDWVLLHWAHFTVHRFICVCLCVFCVFLSYCICVVLLWTRWVYLMGLKPNSYDLSSFSALTLLVGSFDPYKLVPYNVFVGTLNLAQSVYRHWQVAGEWFYSLHVMLSLFFVGCLWFEFSSRPGLLHWCYLWSCLAKYVPPRMCTFGELVIIYCLKIVNIRHSFVTFLNLV